MDTSTKPNKKLVNMAPRFVTIWFCNLLTDWHAIRRLELKHAPFVLALPDHGKLIVTHANATAQREGILPGLSVADARAFVPSLVVLDDDPQKGPSLLKGIAEWFIRYSPTVAVDPPAGLVIDASGCAHLWGGEEAYLSDIQKKINALGYTIRLAMGSTIGVAWAFTHFGNNATLIAPGEEATALCPLPAAALRLPPVITQQLVKLGLRRIVDFIHIPAISLQRRFGESLLQRINQALGLAFEAILPVQPPLLYQERLPCLEPIVTAKGIQIALQRLLEDLCQRLRSQEMGLRVAHLKGYRVDGKIECVSISTNRPSCSTRHLFKLFEYKLQTITPALGIELFVLEAPTVEPMAVSQALLWQNKSGLDDNGLAELLDRITGKIGPGHVFRFLPQEHHWPERSFISTTDLLQAPAADWGRGRPRPIRLHPVPQPIEVTAPIPDYPPMLFRYLGKLHKIIKADGPERIEQEWWLQEGQHRDYYTVEDEEGSRYWLFRSGFNQSATYQWFIHGFFA